MAIDSLIERRDDGGWSFTWPAPVPPHDLEATALSDTEIDLAWSAAPGATSYSVLRGTAEGGPFVEVGTVDGDEEAFSDTGLEPETTYYYVVRAVTETGTSCNSGVASATTEEA